MHIRRTFFFILAAALIAISMPRAVLAANSAPAIDAFNAAFAKVNSMTWKEHAHEVQGSGSQNRVYAYSFMKPHSAKTLIESGDGSGSGGVWAGGDQVSGHQGGILSSIHLKIDLHDGRAVSIRGYTIPDGLIQNIVGTYADTPGTLRQLNGGKLGGVQTDLLDLTVSNPASYHGITHQQLWLNAETHWPVRQVMYAGSAIVLDQSFTDYNLNANLTENDFPF
jgi:outer membrane lipoprotein-sorting protein